MCFWFDKHSNKIRSIKSNSDTDIDEFLYINLLLDRNHIENSLDKNFEINLKG